LGDEKGGEKNIALQIIQMDKDGAIQYKRGIYEL
jgi:hypothetical protein